MLMSDLDMLSLIIVFYLIGLTIFMLIGHQVEQM